MAQQISDEFGASLGVVYGAFLFPRSGWPFPITWNVSRLGAKNQPGMLCAFGFTIKKRSFLWSCFCSEYLASCIRWGGAYRTDGGGETMMRLLGSSVFWTYQVCIAAYHSPETWRPCVYYLLKLFGRHISENCMLERSSSMRYRWKTKTLHVTRVMFGKTSSIFAADVAINSITGDHS